MRKITAEKRFSSWSEDSNRTNNLLTLAFLSITYTGKKMRTLHSWAHVHVSLLVVVEFGVIWCEAAILDVNLSQSL